MKTQFAMTVAAAAVAVLVASSASASGRQSSATPAAAPVINMMCEGSRTVVTDLPFGGTQNREVAVSFMLRIDTATSIAAIMNPSGTRGLRPGRYPANRVNGNVVIAIPFVDGNNNPQTYTLTLAPDGAFTGQATRTEVPNPMAELGAAFGVDPSALQPRSVSYTTGMCWER